MALSDFALRSIMPQKKNPGVIEHIKGKPRHLIGALVSCLSCQKTVAYSNSKEAGSESPHMFAEAVRQLEAILELCDLVARSLVMKSCDKTLPRISRHQPKLTDLLVRECSLSFRIAYQVVGTLVREAKDKGIDRSDNLTAAFVRDVAQRLTGEAIALSEEAVSRALNPDDNVRSRAVTGGPAPREVEAMLSATEARLCELRSDNDARLAAVSEARSKLGALAARQPAVTTSLEAAGD